MGDPLRIEVVDAAALAPDTWAAIVALCNRAYGEDLEDLFRTFSGATHVIGSLDHVMVSHAMWVTRWLQPGEAAPLRTAYVEMVATEPDYQGQGFATAVMQRLAEEITDYELGGLAPAETQLYARLGWVFWRGRLSIRGSSGLIATPEERVMILRLPKTPPLDLDAPLSAEWREGEVW